MKPHLTALFIAAATVSTTACSVPNAKQAFNVAQTYKKGANVQGFKVKPKRFKKDGGTWYGVNIKGKF